jgi:superfamily I DNA/RNA helicase
VERAVRLIAHNRERFAKTIRARPDAGGRLILAPDPADDPTRLIRLLRGWPDDDGTRSVLARTNRELRPAIVAALALDQPFRAGSVALLVDDDRLDGLLERLGGTRPDAPLLVRVETLRRAVHRDLGGLRELASALLAWAAPFRDLEAFLEAIADTRRRLGTLRRDDARLTFATAHSTKGLEFDHVVVVGMEEGRFPSGRAVTESEEPERALEEERRLGYVAWTRARRTLTLSYDPAVPSPFLLEAFTPDELGLTAHASPSEPG